LVLSRDTGDEVFVVTHISWDTEGNTEFNFVGVFTSEDRIPAHMRDNNKVTYESYHIHRAVVDKIPEGW
jgi:hypothetical protein